MRARNRKYVASGRFIHDELVLRCNGSVEHVYKLWKRDKRIDCGVLVWPVSRPTDDNGQTIEGSVSMRLSNDPEIYSQELAALMERVPPYAVFFIRQEPDRIMAVLETPVSSRMWTIPIHRSADVFVLGTTEIVDGCPRLGFVKQDDPQ